MTEQSVMVKSSHTLSQPGFASMKEDILAQIFLLLSRADDIRWGDHRIEDGKWDWACVSEVCRYWHVVATGTPKLWAFIDNFCWTKRFQMSLKRSKNASLTISYREITGSEDIPFGNLKIAMKEMGRIVHLALQATFTEAQAIEFFPYIDLPAPRMQTMSINIGVSTLTLPHFNLPSTVPGVLKEVLLYDINAPESIPRYTCLSGLSRLELRGCFLSLSELLHILMACPALKVLHVGYCNIDSSDFLFTNLETIHLPYLEKIYLDDIRDFTIGSAILQSIDAPNVSQWTMQCEEMLDMDGIAKLDIFSSLLKRDYLAKEISVEVNCLADLDDTLSSFTLAGNKRGFGIRFDQVDRNAVLKRCIDVFKQHLTKVSLLQLEVSDDSITTETWSSVFSACASVKVLNIRLGYEDVDSMYYEAPARTLQVEELGISFPFLEHLVVHWQGSIFWDDPEQFIDDLEDLLTRRSANGLPVRKVTVLSSQVGSKTVQVFFRGLGEIENLKQWVLEVIRMLDPFYDERMEKNGLTTNFPV